MRAAVAVFAAALLARLAFWLLSDQPLLYSHQYHYFTNGLRIFEHPDPWSYLLRSDEWRTWARHWTIAPLYYPFEALVFSLFGAPLIRMMGGEAAETAFAPPRTTRARLAQNVASAPGREDYIRVTLEPRQGVQVAVPLPGKSGAIFSLVQADGMVCIPHNEEGKEAGEEVEIILF